MKTHSVLRPLLNLPLLSCLLSCLLGSSIALAQDGQRWFQIELSIFTNENPADRESEIWTPDVEPLRYPGSLQRLRDLLDLLVIDDLLLTENTALNAVAADGSGIPVVQTVEDYIRATGPFPADRGVGFRFFDFDRDPFLRLPTTASDFQQTNRAIENSPEHRLLYHALWRQPVQRSADATPLYVSGGEHYGGTPELQGSVTIRFNPGADRVVIDADLWLSEFSTVVDDNIYWELPAVPPRARRDYEQRSDNTGFEYQIRRIYRLQQSRDMRSAEFHYLDHPALGLIVTVNPYEVPPVAPAIPDAGLLEVIPEETSAAIPQQLPQ